MYGVGGGVDGQVPVAVTSVESAGEKINDSGAIRRCLSTRELYSNGTTSVVRHVYATQSARRVLDLNQDFVDRERWSVLTWVHIHPPPDIINGYRPFPVRNT